MRHTKLLLATALLAAGCSGSEGEGRTIVASIYPLAYAAERMVPPGWEVIDLTPPGVEAHDLDLSLEQRAAIEEADLVLYLGRIGFQPQVETAVEEAMGEVVSLEGVASAYTGSAVHDPHFWLAPSSMRQIILNLSVALQRVDPEMDLEDETLWRDASRMHAAYHRSLEEADCRYDTLIVTHEAFAALELYGLSQFGLSGVTPESEPSAGRLSEAQRLIDEGNASAVFHEEHEEAKRIAESFAADAGVPALPLSTLESQPSDGNYLTVMRENLAALEKGLQCR